MPIEKKPFRKYKLDEENGENRVKITISLNAQEQQMVEHLMEDFDVKSPGVALKKAAETGQNVIHNTFGCESFRYLMRRERARASDYDKVKIGKM